MKIKLILACFFGLIATQSYAQTFNSDGVVTGQSKSQTVEMAADHRIVDVDSSFLKFEMVNDANPMKFLKGPCFGMMEIRGGAIEGGGVCVLDGLEGDRVLLGWDARRLDPKGQVHGYWTVNSGTGIWLQASGGGTFSQSVNPSNGAVTNNVKGAITLR